MTQSPSLWIARTRLYEAVAGVLAERLAYQGAPDGDAAARSEVERIARLLGGAFASGDPAFPHTRWLATVGLGHDASPDAGADAPYEMPMPVMSHPKHPSVMTKGEVNNG